jgi:hypothetical protein
MNSFGRKVARPSPFLRSADLLRLHDPTDRLTGRNHSVRLTKLPDELLWGMPLAFHRESFRLAWAVDSNPVLFTVPFVTRESIA